MAHLGTVPIRGVLSQRLELEVCDGGHRLDVMKKSVASIRFPVFPQNFTLRWNPRSRKARDLGHPRFSSVNV